MRVDIMFLFSLPLAIGSAAQKIHSGGSSPRPYRIDVDLALIERSLLKVKLYQPTTNIDVKPWEDGPPAKNISSIRDYWLTAYDWVAIQDKMNSQHPHYITTVNQTASYGRPLDVHFIDQPSNRSDATPLLMLHGWPSSSNDWGDVINPLTSPQDVSDPAFHVVAPDLPGFGFSSAPTKPGLGAPQIASALVELVAQLGYDKWILYSTDLGFYVAMHMSQQYSDQVLLHATDFFYVPGQRHGHGAILAQRDDTGGDEIHLQPGHLEYQQLRISPTPLDTAAVGSVGDDRQSDGVSGLDVAVGVYRER